MHEIDEAGLDEWVAWLVAERKLSAKTRWNVVVAMSAFLGWLRKIGEITVEAGMRGSAPKERIAGAK